MSVSWYVFSSAFANQQSKQVSFSGVKISHFCMSAMPYLFVSFSTPFEVLVGGEVWCAVKAGWPRYHDTVKVLGLIFTEPQSIQFGIQGPGCPYFWQSRQPVDIICCSYICIHSSSKPKQLFFYVD